MSTKVKGEAIKDGSIPLSALGSGNDLLSGLVGDNSSFIDMKEDNVNYDPRTSKKTVYIKIPIRNKMFALQKYSTITLVEGPPAEIIWDDDGIRITGYSSYYTPIIYFALKAPTPNWNAQQGEAGYIEYKPFGWELYENYSFREFIDEYKISLITSTNDTGPVFECYLGFNSPNYLWTIHRLDYIDVKSIEYTPVHIEQTGFNLSYVFKDEGYYLIFTHFDEYGYQNDITFDELIDNIDKYSNTIISTNVNKKVLSSEFISDKVIKTVPQSLSSTNKNQALTNLGIPRLITITNNDFINQSGTKTTNELNELLEGCVLQEVPILGFKINYANNTYNTYIYTSHQEYDDFGNGVQLYKLVIGNFLYKERDDYNIEVSPIIIITYNEDNDNYDIIVEYI